jgi:hypothetical protein
VDKNNVKQIPYDGIGGIRFGEATQGYAVIKKQNGEVNLINQDLKIMWKEWVKDICIDEISEGIACCEVGDDYEVKYINVETGETLGNTIFWTGYPFENGLAYVKNEYNKVNMLNKQGKLLFDEWFNEILRYDNRLRIISHDKSAITDCDGNVLGKFWAEIVLWRNDEELILIAQDGDNAKYIIDGDGKIICVYPEGFRNIYRLGQTGKHIIIFSSYSLGILGRVINPDGGFGGNTMRVTQCTPEKIECYDNNCTYTFDMLTGKVYKRQRVN